MLLYKPNATDLQQVSKAFSTRRQRKTEHDSGDSVETAHFTSVKEILQSRVAEIIGISRMPNTKFLGRTLI